MAPAVARRQHDDIAVFWWPRISAPAIAVLRYVPVPFWLRLEVPRLRRIVVRLDGFYGFGGGVVPEVVDRSMASVVIDGHMAIQADKDSKDDEQEKGNKEDGSAWGLSATNIHNGDRQLVHVHACVRYVCSGR